MERKLATVVFVDLVGSTEQLSAADPEIVRLLLARSLCTSRRLLMASNTTASSPTASPATSTRASTVSRCT